MGTNSPVVNLRRDARGQRDVTGLQVHTGGLRIGLHDRQERSGGKVRRLVDERVQDLGSLGGSRSRQKTVIVAACRKRGQARCADVGGSARA